MYLRKKIFSFIIILSVIFSSINITNIIAYASELQQEEVVQQEEIIPIITIIRKNTEENKEDRNNTEEINKEDNKINKEVVQEFNQDDQDINQDIKQLSETTPTGVQNIPEDIIYLNEEIEIMVTPVECVNNIDENFPDGVWKIKRDEEISSFINFSDIVFTNLGKYEIYYKDTLIHIINTEEKSKATEDSSITKDVSNNEITKNEKEVDNIEKTDNINNTERLDNIEQLDNTDKITQINNINNINIIDNVNIIDNTNKGENIDENNKENEEIKENTEINNEINLEKNSKNINSFSSTEEITEITPEIIELETDENTVSYDTNNNLSFTIPKSLELGKMKENKYMVKVEGEIGEKVVEVNTPNKFTLTNENNEIIEVEINNNNRILTKEELANGSNELLFNMDLNELPVGTWNGVFEVNVEVDDPSIRKTVTNTKDGITLTKHADYIYDENGNIITDENGNPKIKITFTVDTSDMQIEKETIIAKDTDVVLVIDKSGSMEDNDKITKAKNNAKDFIDKILSIEGLDVNIGITSFGEKATIDQELTNDKDLLNSSIDNLVADGGTFLQAGIYKGQEILKKGTGENKIMIILSDGLPTYRYEFNKKYLVIEDKQTIDINSNLAYNSTYTAYTNFNYSSSSSILFDNGNTDYKWGDFSSKVQLGYDSTISQGYLARNELPNLSIYTVGYDINEGKTAETVLKNIADKDKYLLASVDGENNLDIVISSITSEVEKTIEGVNISDQIPEEMSFINDSFITDHNINLIKTTEGVKMTWNEQLKTEELYEMSFNVILNKELISGDLINNYFNTNGKNISLNGIGADSSSLIYGIEEDEFISLYSPQLKLFN